MHHMIRQVDAELFINLLPTLAAACCC